MMLIHNLIRGEFLLFWTIGNRDVAFARGWSRFLVCMLHLNNVLKGVEVLVQLAAPKFFK